MGTGVSLTCCTSTRTDDGDGKTPFASRTFKPKILTKPVISSSNWNLIFAPTWLTDSRGMRRLCAYNTDRAYLYNTVHPDLDSLWYESNIVMEPGEMLLMCAFYDNRSPNFVLGCVVWDRARVTNKSPEAETDDFQVNFETVMEVRIWDKEFVLRKVLEMKPLDNDQGLPISSAIVCSAFFVYVGDEFGRVHAWEKISFTNMTKMISTTSFTASHHTGKIVAMDADPHFCYTLGDDQLICVSLADGLTLIFKINLGSPMSLYDPKLALTTKTIVRSGAHLLRPASRWAMSQSVPSKRGVGPQGPRGFIFVSAISQDGEGVLMKFVLNRSNPVPLEVQSIIAHQNRVRVCVLGPYDNGPLLSIGENENDVHFWEVHSMQLLMVMNITAPIYTVCSIAVHPQECFYSINNDGQVAIWAFDEF